MKLLKKLSLIDIILILSPIIDVLICMLQKYTNLSLIGTLLRGGLLIGLLLYIFFIKKEYDKRIINYTIVLLLFAYIFEFNLFLLNKTIVVEELIGLIKYLFYPLIVAFLLSINNKNKEKIYYSLYICAIIYAFFLLIPLLFNVNFKSYSSIKIGNIGWFFSANEISSIVSILCPFVIIRAYSTKDIRLKLLYTIIAILFIYTIFTIGTKTVIASIFISLLLLLFCNIYQLIKKRVKLNTLLTVVVIIFSVFCFIKSSSLQNIKTQRDTFNNSDIAKRDSIIVSNALTNEIMNNHYKIMYDFRDEPIYITNKYLNLIFSSRDVFLMEHITSFKKVGIQEKLFGMGQIYNEKSAATSKLVEIDFFDIFFNYGIIGFIIYFSFIIYLLFIIVRYFFQNFQSVMNDYGLCASYISIFITFILSCLSGHIIGAPAVSLIAAIVISNVGSKLYNYHLIKEKVLNKKFIIKIIIALLTSTLIVFGVSVLSKDKDISNSFAISIDNNSLIVKDNKYSINEIKKETITSDYAIDELTYYNVFYNGKSIVKLLLVSRSFPDSDKTISFIVGKNYTKFNILITIDSFDNEYLKGYIYELKNYNYDGLNHSIVKDLTDYNNGNQLLLKDDQYFDVILIKDELLKNIDIDYLFANSWISFDGRYTKLDETIPKGQNIYARKCYDDIENEILVNYKKTNNEVLKMFINSYVHSLINYIPRYKDSVWLTEYSNLELSNLGIKAFYVNIDDNIKLAEYFKDINNNEMSQLLAKYLVQQHNQKYLLFKDNINLPLDYYNNDIKISFLSLKNLIKIIAYLLNSSTKEYQKLGNLYLNNISENWINDDGNLYLRINSNFEYEGNDTSTECLDNLLMLQNIIVKKNGKKNTIIYKLIKSKYDYLKNNNYSIDEELINKLRVGGFIE